MADEDLPIQPNTLLPYTGLAEPAPVLPIQPQNVNPLADAARMLQGFAAGVQGRANPYIAYEQRAQELAQRQADQAFAQRLHLEQLALQERGRKTAEEQLARQEKRDADTLQLSRERMGQELGLKLIDSVDPDMRVQGYRILQQSGALAPNVDPAKIGVLGKVDYNQKRNEAIAFIENGIDPEDPAFGGQYAFLPLKQYKQMHANNPLGLNPLRATPMSEEALLKSQIARIASLPPEAIAASPTLQNQLRGAQTALGVGLKVEYGVRVNSELAAMGYKVPSEAPPDKIAEAIRRASVEQGPPDLNRLVAREQELERKIADASTPQELAALKDVKAELQNVIAQRKKLTGVLAEVQGAKTAATQSELPLPEKVQEDIGAYNAVIATAAELKTFSPEKIQRYTGMLRNPAERLKRAAGDVTGGLVGGQPNEEFSRFEALMGRFQTNLFALGGKQLTGMERQVALMSTPTGREPGGATEMLAKARYLEAFTRVARNTRATLAKVGKGNVDVELMDRMLTDEMTKAGLAVPTAENPRPWMARSQAPPGYRPVTP